jgi:hypothetical protein
MPGAAAGTEQSLKLGLGAHVTATIQPAGDPGQGAQQGGARQHGINDHDMTLGAADAEHLAHGSLHHHIGQVMEEADVPDGAEGRVGEGERIGRTDDTAHAGFFQGGNIDGGDIGPGNAIEALACKA